MESADGTEVNPSESKQEENDVNMVKLMKLAVAVAVIRSKPPNRSAKLQAEHLSSHNIMTQHRWREKCENAHKEILHLKQQLLLSNSSFASQVSGDESASDSQSLFPTPPSSSEATPTPFPRDNEILHKEVMFFQSLISLQRAGDRVSPLSLQGSTHGTLHCAMSDVTRQTVDHSLQCVRDALSDPTRPLTSSLLSQAITNVIRILEHTPENPWAHKCQKTLLEVMSVLLQRFLTMDRFQQGEAITYNRLRELLLSFCQISSLNVIQGVGDVFLEHVQDFSSHLRKSRDNSVTFCPVLAENICDVISALEYCIHHNLDTLSTCEGRRVCVHLQDSLEVCLLHLTQYYPLLAHAVWRIGNTIELCLSHQSNTT